MIFSMALKRELSILVPDNLKIKIYKSMLYPSKIKNLNNQYENWIS